jgi:hypothetical protein
VRKLATGTGGNLPELRAMLVKSQVTASNSVIRDAPMLPVVPSLPDSTSEPGEAHAA